jgi:hypothetical protein
MRFLVHEFEINLSIWAEKQNCLELLACPRLEPLKHPGFPLGQQGIILNELIKSHTGFHKATLLIA